MDSKKPHYRVSLSEQALNHEKLMRAIVKNLADTPMVLKGGTALYLGYGLNRFSEDLDFFRGIFIIYFRKHHIS